MEKRILVIAGMHRSGTSLITQWLQRCGLAVGGELMPANRGNQQGYFEDMEFVRLHEEILAGAGLPDTGLTADRLPVLSSDVKQRIAALLEKKSAGRDQWAWKDPRTCLFLSVYRELAPDADCLVIYRDFQSCVYSLVNRMVRDARADYLRSGKRHAELRWKWYKKKRTEKRLLEEHVEAYLKVWIRYNRELLEHIETAGDRRCIVVDYRSLLTDDRKVFDLLTGSRGFRLSYIPFSEVYSAKLMNAGAIIEPYIGDKDLLSEAEGLAELLRGLAIR